MHNICKEAGRIHASDEARNERKKRDRIAIIDIGKTYVPGVTSAHGPSQLTGLAVGLPAWGFVSSRHRCTQEAGLLAPSPHI